MFGELEQRLDKLRNEIFATKKSLRGKEAECKELTWKVNTMKALAYKPVLVHASEESMIKSIKGVERSNVSVTVTVRVEGEGTGYKCRFVSDWCGDPYVDMDFEGFSSAMSSSIQEEVFCGDGEEVSDRIKDLANFPSLDNCDFECDERIYTGKVEIEFSIYYQPYCAKTYLDVPSDVEGEPSFLEALVKKS